MAKPAMNLAQRNALLELMKQYEHLIAENQALKSLLTVIEKHGPFTHSTWQQELENLMNSPAREEYRKQFGPIVQEINSAFVDTELSRLLSKIPIKGRLN